VTLRHNRIVRRSTPPNRSWSGAIFVEIAVPGNTSILLGSFGLSNQGIDETQLRALGSITVRSDQQAVTESQIGAFGLIVVSQSAITAGIASIPTPLTEIGDDGWFTYMPFCQTNHVFTTTGSTYAPRYDFDSKAKRVVHDGSSMAVVVENGTADAFVFSVIIRMLSMVRGT